MADIIDLGSSMLKHKGELETRDKIIQQQQLQIEELKKQIASASAVTDMLKLVLMDAIATQKQTLTNNDVALRHLQDLLKRLS
jgi:hypothetical protein